MYQERSKIWEAFVDEGSFSKQCVVLDPEAEAQIFSLNSGWVFSMCIVRHEFEEFREQVSSDRVFFAAPGRAWSAMKRRSARRPEVYERNMKERDA